MIFDLPYMRATPPRNRLCRFGARIAGKLQYATTGNITRTGETDDVK
jgi:hypothetical protein